jgi:predicted metal-binding protein
MTLSPPSPSRPILHICVTCRGGQALALDALALDPKPPGAQLHDALAQMNAAAGGPVDIRQVSCLAACDRGCTAAIAMPGRFSYLLGGLSPQTAEDVFDYALRYAASKTGLVLPSKRAESLRHAVLGRFPGAESPVP